MPSELVKIFILPPSASALKERLENRGDSLISRKERLNDAANIVEHCQGYDYVLINENLDRTIEEIRQILETRQLKPTRPVNLADFVQTLISGLRT